MQDQRAAVAADFFRTFYNGDVAEACEYLDPAVVYVVPGRQPAAGTFQGVEAVAGHLATFLRLTGNAIDVLAWEDWLVGTNNVAGLLKVHLQREGQMHDFRVIYLVSTVERNGETRISRIEAFYADQAAFDRFFLVQP